MHYQSNSRLGFILPSEDEKKGKELHFSLFFLHLPQNSLFSSHAIHRLIDLFASCEHGPSLAVVRADHRAQFDANLVYCALTLAEVHNADLLKSWPLTEVMPGGDTDSEDASTQRAV